jgi:PhzF family phenazine biosynthesis protein
MGVFKVQAINSFSINGTGGNPAGVVLDADELTKDQKQAIAFKAGLSETAFVSRSSVADFKLEFFTPTRQIPHCGHATIATFWYLNSLGKIQSSNSSKETIDGTREIFFIGDEPFMQQLPARFSEVPDHERIFKSIGINGGLRVPLIGNTGNSFLLIELDEQSELKKLRPSFKEISDISSALDCVGYYVFALSKNGASIQTRMFAPYYGINEESATGMAAGPLACLLYQRMPNSEMIVNQGKYMSTPSESRLKAKITAENGKITKLLVGGSAYVNKTLEITL